MKASGQHFTPTDLATYVASRVHAYFPRQNGSATTVLDPACGDGELLAALAAALPPATRAATRFIGCDVDAAAIAIASSRLAELGAKDRALYECDFLAVIAAQQQRTLFPNDNGVPAASDLTADVVIANPPYVRTQVMGATRSQSMADAFGLSGRVDLYHAFVVAISRVLRPGGVVATITSNRFLTLEGCADLRRLLTDAYDIKELVDLGDTKLFGAAVLPAVLVGVRRPIDECVPARIEVDFVRAYEERASRTDTTDAPENVESLFDPIRSRRCGRFSVGGRTLRIDSGVSALPRDPSHPWAITTDAETEWIACVDAEAEARFADLATIRVGIKTTADSVFVRSDWEDLPEEMQPETALLRPLLLASRAQRWRAMPPSDPLVRVLYTHEKRGRKRVAIDLRKFPRAEAYLESHRSQLEGRKYVLKAGRNWFEIWVPQDPNGWSQPKIVFPDISPEPRFFVDHSGAVVQGACYWLTLNDGVDPEWLPVLAALANSSLMRSYHDLTFQNRLYAGRRRFMTQNVKKYPVPSLGRSERSMIAALVQELVGANCDRETARIEQQIDAIVERAFGVEATPKVAAARG